MRRTYRLPAVVVLSALSVLATAAERAEARGNSEALASLRGDFEFGMSPKEVVKVLAKDIGASYKEKIRETHNVYQQDKLRRERDKKVARIKKTYIKFGGDKTGWDVSIIDDQFAHETGESMLVYWETNPDTGKDQRRFFFFHHGRLYKMFIALSPEMLQGEQKKFGYFRRIMEQRYGSGKISYEKDKKGNKWPDYLEWKTRKYHVRAINKLRFYGSFCLMIADREREQIVAQAREAVREPEEPNKMIEAIVEKKGDKGPTLDDSSHVVDSILEGE